MEQKRTDDLKSWIQKELVSDIGMSEKILSEYKEQIPSLLSIGRDGRIIVFKSDLSAKLQIAIYLIGAAYAKIAELRSTEVSNKEIIEQLKMKKGTVNPTLKELREEGLIIQKEDGLHSVNYGRIKDIIKEIKSD